MLVGPRAWPELHEMCQDRMESTIRDASHNALTDLGLWPGAPTDNDRPHLGELCLNVRTTSTALFKVSIFRQIALFDTDTGDRPPGNSDDLVLSDWERIGLQPQRSANMRSGLITRNAESFWNSLEQVLSPIPCEGLKIGPKMA